jgi:hypothetical protein
VEEFVRILQCKSCKSLEQVPDVANKATADIVLNTVVVPHDDKGHPYALRLYRIEKKHWDSPSTRQEVIKRIQEESGVTGLDASFYTTRDTLTADAHTCFQQHNRNPDCGDYKHDSKRLKPDTAAERKAANLPKYRATKDVYLCEFCPVHSKWRSAQYKKYGLDQ